MLGRLAKRAHGGEEGLILPLLLVLLAIGGLLIAPTLGHGYTSLASSSITEDRAQELHAISEISRAISTEQRIEILLPLIARLVSERCIGRLGGAGGAERQPDWRADPGYDSAVG